MLANLEYRPRLGSPSVEACQPSRAPLGSCGAVAVATLHENLLGPNPLNFLLEQKTQLRQVPLRSRNRKLLALTKTSPSDSFHCFIDIRTVGRIHLANQGVESCCRPQCDFKRTAVPGVVLENLQADVSDRPPLRRQNLRKVAPQHNGVKGFLQGRNSRVAQQA